MSGRISALSGIEKASVLIMCLGPETSWKVFEQLSPREQDILGAEILRLRRVDAATRLAVMEEVSKRLSGSKGAGRLGNPRVSGLVDKRGLREAFGWLESLPPADVAAALSESDPFCAAVVLMGVASGPAEIILSCMSSESQDAIAESMGRLGQVSGETVEAIERSLRMRLARTPAGKGAARRGVLSVFRDAIRAASRRALRGGGRALSPNHPNGARDIPDGPIPQEVDTADLCVVLRVSDERTRESILRRLEPARADRVRRELEMPVSVTIAQVEAAQQRLSSAMGCRL